MSHIRVSHAKQLTEWLALSIMLTNTPHLFDTTIRMYIIYIPIYVLLASPPLNSAASITGERIGVNLSGLLMTFLLL